MSENKDDDICSVPIPTTGALLKRCGNPTCLYKSTHMVDREEFRLIRSDLVKEFHAERAKKALASVLESTCIVETEDHGGYSTTSASVIVMRPDAFEKLIEALYRAGLEDGAAL